MQTPKSIPLFLLSILWVSGIDARPTSIEMRIIDGAKPGPSSPTVWATVGLVFDEKLPVKAFCSGTLIAPGLVLTAAHCLPRAPAFVFFQNATDKKGIFRPVTRTAVHEDYGNKYLGFLSFDVGWVQFSGDVPAGYSAIEIDGEKRGLAVGDSVLFSGYGLVNRSGRLLVEPNTKMEASAPISYLPVGGLTRGESFRIRGKSHLCNGDSGGPGFVRRGKEWFLVGVNSWSSGQDCKGEISGLTLARSFKAWVSRTSRVKLAGRDEAGSISWGKGGKTHSDLYSWINDSALSRDEYIALKDFSTWSNLSETLGTMDRTEVSKTFREKLKDVFRKHLYIPSNVNRFLNLPELQEAMKNSAVTSLGLAAQDYARYASFIDGAKDLQTLAITFFDPAIMGKTLVPRTIKKLFVVGSKKPHVKWEMDGFLGEKVTEIVFVCIEPQNLERIQDHFPALERIRADGLETSPCAKLPKRIECKETNRFKYDCPDYSR